VSCEKNISYRFLYRGKKGEKKKVALELYVCVHTDKERERERETELFIRNNDGFKLSSPPLF
jgi:hypothetical protein